MSLVSYAELKRVEQLARVSQHLDLGEDGPIGRTRRGPASWWRMGIAFLGLMIAALLIYRLLD